jgi:hypothetical protein
MSGLSRGLKSGLSRGLESWLSRGLKSGLSRGLKSGLGGGNEADGPASIARIGVCVAGARIVQPEIIAHQDHVIHSDARNAPSVTTLRVNSQVLRLRVLRVLRQIERLLVHPISGDGEFERGGRVVGEVYVHLTSRLSIVDVACCELNWELGVCVYVCVRVCGGMTYDIENIEDIENRREQGAGNR